MGNVDTTLFEDGWLLNEFSMNSCFDKEPTESEIETIKKFGEGFLIDQKITGNRDMFEYKDEQIIVDYVINPYKVGYLVRLLVRVKMKNKVK